MQEILSSFALTEAKLEPFGSGLINRTWKVYAPERNYILQRINVDVFKQPQDIAYNVRLIADYLQKYHPGYQFVSPLHAASGDDIIFCKGNGWFRLMPFVENSFTLDVATTPEQAYEAARQFGRFTRLLSGFDSTQLKITIPQFHDLSLRYQQFLNSIANGNEKRKREARSLINELLYHKCIVEQYQSMVGNPAFKLRVTHHDTKISNVLFDQSGKGVCVIDLDTIMPGYFISDVGDMIRTYVSPVSEEECDVEKIVLREDFYVSIIEGYSDEMKDQLTAMEKKQFMFSGKFMTYMQALRFLTDYLNNDVYYGVKYEGHNLVRAKNQMTLLKRLHEIDDIK
ncbi:aminoglycoside phosphotransferase family protein [Chitinophagaceae bacterium 26-R-25]|nr:aminoglycoside phosphotransferase family protein [Chitinophagaceae bacterium 26-R-25]